MKPQICEWCGGEIRRVCGDRGVFTVQTGDGWYHEECLEPHWDRWEYYEFRYAENYDEWLESRAYA